MSEKDVADFDQAMTSLMRLLPPSLWQLYEALKTQGFSHEDAMRLTSDWLISTTTRGG